MRIRLAEESDFARVYALLCELEGIHMDEARVAEIYRENLNNSDVRCFVAEEEARVVGYAGLHMQRLLHHAARIGELQEIIVEEGQRSSGTGSMLFAAVRRAAAEAGCAQLEVCCNLLRARSHDFYERQGMRRSHYKFTLPL